jgi:hypothetical protein
VKPCPFCGSRNIRYHASDMGHLFRCLGCYAEGPPGGLDQGSTGQETRRLRTEAAAKAWNRRALTPPQEDAT